MEVIQIGYMKELTFFDFLIVFDAVSSRLKDQEFECDRMQRSAEKIIAHTKKMQKVKDVKPSHPLTKVIKDNIRIRTQFLGSLRLRIDSFMLSHKPEHRVAAKELKYWLQQYKKELYPPSNFTQSHYVKIMMDDIKKQAYIRDAVALLYLDDLLEEIATRTADIEERFIERTKSLTQNAVVCKELRDAAYADFKTLLNTMESTHSLSMSETEKIHLKKLSVYINEPVVMMHSLLKSNKTRKNKRKEKEQEDSPIILHSGLGTPESMVFPNIASEEFGEADSNATLASNPLDDVKDKSTKASNIKGKDEIDGNGKLPSMGKN